MQGIGDVEWHRVKLEWQVEWQVESSVIGIETKD